jgi:hypothetical protein
VGKRWWSKLQDAGKGKIGPDGSGKRVVQRVEPRTGWGREWEEKGVEEGGEGTE